MSVLIAECPFEFPVRHSSAIAKTVDFFAKTIADPLFWAVYTSVATIGFFASIWTGTLLASPTFLVLTAVAGIIGLGWYICRSWKEIFYEFSLLFISIRNFFAPRSYPWWNQVDENLYLGGMPLKEKGHLEIMLCRTNISAILSVVEEFELANRWPFTTPIAHSEWREKGFETMQVGAVDLEGANLEEVEQGVEFLRDMILKGRQVYVHCKAGFGRSATLVACYLLKYGRKDGRTFQSVQEAIEYVLEKRSQVLLQNPMPNAVIHQFFDKHLA